MKFGVMPLRLRGALVALGLLCMGSAFTAQHYAGFRSTTDFLIFYLALSFGTMAAIATARLIDRASDVQSPEHIYKGQLASYRHWWHTLGWIVLVGLVPRVYFLFQEPQLSNDIYRYVWDGLVSNAGFNPFEYIPTDPALDGVLDPHQMRSQLNHPQVRTIYPPVAQWLFSLGTNIAPSPLGIKIVLFIFDCLAAMTLSKLARAEDRSPLLSAAYWWNPFVMIEVCAAGHLDVVVLAFLLSALFSLHQDRPISTAVYFAASIATKYYTLILLPVFFRRQGFPFLIVFAAALFFCFIPFADAGVHVFETLGLYGHAWEFNGSLYALLVALGVDATAVRVLLGLALCGGILWIHRGRFQETEAIAMTLAIYLLCQPTVHPWYVLILLPFAVLIEFPLAWAFALLTPLSYEILRNFRLSGDWSANPLVAWIIYIPIYLLFFWQLRKRRLRLAGV